MAFTIFSEYAFLQHTCVWLEETPCLRSQAYFVPPHISLKDGIDFAYGVSFSVLANATYSVDKDDLIAASNINLQD